MKIYGIIGKNIQYTLSPAMHNAAFGHFGIDAEYRVFDIEEKEISVILDAISLGGKISGVNVTIPYKIKVKELLASRENSSLDKEAELLGAVNTVALEGGKTVGYNTDGRGFYESLLEDTGLDPAGKSVLVFGAGGAGSAVSLFLASLEKRPARILLYDIDKEKLMKLALAISRRFGASMGTALEESEVARKIASSDLVVNATGLGTKKDDPTPFHVTDMKPAAVLYDLVYARETRIMEAARGRGLVVAGGLGMLVNQGAHAFRIWTGKPLDETKRVMRNAAVKDVGAGS